MNYQTTVSVDEKTEKKNVKKEIKIFDQNRPDRRVILLESCRRGLMTIEFKS